MERIPIEELIPQRKPFEMIGSLLSCEGGVTVTEFTVPETAVFARDGKFQTAGIVENMAQSAVAGVGYEARMCGKAVTIGYIGNVHNLTIRRLPLVGETLTTSIERKSEILGIAISEAVVKVGEEVIAEATIKTSQVE